MTVFTYGTRLSKFEAIVDDTTYIAQSKLPNGILPVEKDILCCMLYLLRPEKTKNQRTINEAADLLTLNLIEHWHLFNIYTIPVSSISLHKFHFRMINKKYTDIRCNEFKFCTFPTGIQRFQKNPQVVY